MLDDDGYPDTESLNRLETFQPDDVMEYVKLIEENWWAPDWGFKIFKIKGRDFLSLHTAGWSGNEEVIRAIKKNLFVYRLQIERIGGHYLFELEYLKGDKEGNVSFKDFPDLCPHCNGWGLI